MAVGVIGIASIYKSHKEDILPRLGGSFDGTTDDAGVFGIYGARMILDSSYGSSSLDYDPILKNQQAAAAFMAKLFPELEVVIDQIG